MRCWKSCDQFLWTSTIFTVSTTFCFASNTARLALQLMRSFTSLRIQNAYLATLKYNSKSGSLTQPQSRTDLRAPSPCQLWRLSECPASVGRPHCSSHTQPSVGWPSHLQRIPSLLLSVLFHNYQNGNGAIPPDSTHHCDPIFENLSRVLCQGEHHTLAPSLSVILEQTRAIHIEQAQITHMNAWMHHIGASTKQSHAENNQFC